VHVWAFPFVAWNFFSKKSLSPFWLKLIPLVKNTLLIVQCLIEMIIFHHSLQSQNWGVHNSLLVWAVVFKMWVHIPHSPFFAFFIWNTIANPNLTSLWHPQVKFIGKGLAWPHPPFLEVPLLHCMHKHFR